MAAFGQRSKATKFDPTNYISARHLDAVHLIWTKFGMDILVYPKNKHVELEEFFICLKFQDGRRRSKIEFQTKFLLKNHISTWLTHPVHPIWTKRGRNILLNHRNKSIKEILTYRKIQDGCCGRHYGK